MPSPRALMEQFSTVAEALARVSEILSQEAPSPEELGLTERILEGLLVPDRENAGLIFLLGSVYMKAKRYAIAEHWLRHSLDMCPGMPEALNNLGFVYQQEGRFDEAKTCFEKALEGSPGNSEILSNIASLLVNNGTPELAVEACDRAIEADPDNPDAKWNKALALLEMGNWREGWKAYRQGLEMRGQSSTQRKRRTYPKDIPHWDGEKGKTVVVYGEQGVGDEIMAASMLPDLIEDCEVIVEAHPRLVDIYRHSWGDRAAIYGTRKVNPRELPWLHWHEPQAKIPILGLGEFYRNDGFPKKAYLKPFDNHVEDSHRWLESLGERPRIGISWHGGSMVTRTDVRSIPLPDWLPLLNSIDATWVSLQYDPPDSPGAWAPIVAKFNEHKGTSIVHDTDRANDLDVCYGGLIHALDLVICINTSLVHACGAYGVPCWTLTPSKPAWRYGLSGAEMPWYGPWVQQYRQADGETWPEVLERVKEALTPHLMEAA